MELRVDLLKISFMLSKILRKIHVPLFSVEQAVGQLVVSINNTLTNLESASGSVDLRSVNS